MSVKKVILAKPRGFCAGVEMAIETVERARKKHGAPLYVFHEIVHNQYVVNEFEQKGVVFVNSLNDVPSQSNVIFSAHGVSPAIWQQAKEKQLRWAIDATCPLVEKVHREVRKYAAQDYWIILVGNHKHDEIAGTSGEAPDRTLIVETVSEAAAVMPPSPEKLVVLTQTTLSVDDTKEIIDVLKRRFPKMITPAKEDICYATQNRQDAVKQLAIRVDLVLVIGSKNSENSNQLVKVARSLGKPAYLIDDYRGIDADWLNGINAVGITSGASVPDNLVQEAVKYFQHQGAQAEQIGLVEENIHFALPSEVTGMQ
ncbi:MAG TPA: 4-hydroxy-3-methylbut-2-enyl diphosphate reductase [Candidatus Limnocylindrales bacterium]|nr:4-hydroxy-3-methylbut-2-enyl diphosphate reductase [Candidatus Limnocylindrales bacterium]